MLEIRRGVVYLMHPRERSAWKINFLHDWEVITMSEEWNSLRKKNVFLSTGKQNKQLCRRNRKLARSLEKFKKVSALKRISRRLKKSWDRNNKKIRKKIKQN